MPGCVFQEKWKVDEKFKDWIKQTNDVHTAYCTACKKKVDIKAMGRTALSSHIKSRKHIDSMESLKKTLVLTDYVKSKSSEATLDPPATAATLNSYVTKNETLNAEIFWCLKTVHSNYSFHSNEDNIYIFQKMFPDSEIAQKMSCGETKSMYMSCFGIAPYFKDLLEDRAKKSTYVLMFDESLNKQIQKKQMDILIRLWNDNKIASRYYTSDFLGHACSIDMLESFENHVEKNLGLRNILQVSMDGPNVNWSCFQKLQEKMEKDYSTKLVDVGSCGLHILHNAFRAGASETKWDIGHKLSSLHTLFDNVPARREDFEKVAGVMFYPLPFCGHRWVENVRVCQRALEFIPSLELYVGAVESKKVKSPDTKSYDTVKKIPKDNLFKAKLEYIVCIAKTIENFLKTYQTDKPMLPFLANDLARMLRSLMNRFVKSSVMETAGTVQKLSKVDIDDKNNLKNHNQIDIGFAADLHVKEMLSRKLISERQALEFRMECRDMLQTIVRRIFKKSPLTYTLVRNLCALDPSEIVKTEEEVLCTRFRRVLNVLHSCKKVEIDACDQLLEEYRLFVRSARHLDPFKNFDKEIHSLDELYYQEMNTGKCAEVPNLWPVVQDLLLLSHGQASVERGFSVNKEVSETNISETTLIARRMIKDHISSVGGLKNVILNKDLLKSAQNGRQKYLAHLEAKKSEEEKIQKGQKRKAIESEVEELRKKIKHIENSVCVLTKEADVAAEKAEELHSFAHISKSNVLRNKVKEQSSELVGLQKQLSEKTTLLRNM